MRLSGLAVGVLQPLQVRALTGVEGAEAGKGLRQPGQVVVMWRPALVSTSSFTRRVGGGRAPHHQPPRLQPVHDSGQVGGIAVAAVGDLAPYHF